MYVYAFTYSFPRGAHPTEPTSQGGEGLPQTTPLLSAWGRKWGPTPQGSMNTSSQRSLMHCSRKPCETHPRGEVRVAAAMPEGHCGGFGTSSRMRCGTLKRLGTRQRRPDNQGHRQLGSHSKSTTAIFSAPTGRLGCRRDSTRAPGERRPPAGTPVKPSSGGRAAGNYRSPTSTQDCRTSLHGFPLMGRDARRAAGRKGPLPETRAGALRRVLTPP